MVTIVLYGKPGCHLCEAVRDSVVLAKEQFEFVFREKSILDDEALFNAYVDDIPVVTVNGEIFSRYAFRAELLEAKLETLTERRKP